MSLTSLRLHQAPDEEPAGEPQPEPETAALPPAAEPGHTVAQQDARSMNWLGQAWMVSRYAAHRGRRQWREASTREGGWINAVLAGRPRSVRDQHDHLRNRKWLPDGHDGGAAERIGEAFHVAIGVPGVACGNLVSAVSSGMWQFAIVWWLFLTPAVLGGALLAGVSARAAVTAAVVVALLPVVWTGLVGLLLAAKRAAGRRAAQIVRRGDDR